MTDQQRTALMNLAQRLVQIDPMDAEDQSEREASLRYVLHALKNAPFDTHYVVSQAEEYLLQRDMRIQRLTPEQRAVMGRWRELRKQREARDSWQQNKPRALSREEHDALLGREEARPVSKEEYDRMMREQG